MGREDLTGMEPSPDPFVTLSFHVTHCTPLNRQEPIEITKPRTAYSDRVGARRTITLYPEARPQQPSPLETGDPSLSSTAAVHDPAARLHAGNDQLLRDQMLPIFSSFDTEGEGFARIDEVQGFLQGPEGPGLSPDQVRDLLRRCSSKGKGQQEEEGWVRVRDLVDNFVLCITGRAEEASLRPRWCTLQEDARIPITQTTTETHKHTVHESCICPPRSCISLSPYVFISLSRCLLVSLSRRVLCFGGSPRVSCGS